MEGAMFYWISWSIWVYLTFILERQNPYRLKLSVLILILIIFSSIHLMYGEVEFYASGIYLLIISYVFISQEKRGAIIYFFICSCIVSMAYVTFHLFEIFDPIWIIFKKEWLMGICFGYLAILLQKTLKGRLIIILTGTINGEFLYAYILSKYQFPYAIGAYDYLDVYALISALLIGWSMIENAGVLLQNHFPFFEKGKQKSS
ncbi:hypothetical protein AA0X95_12000 [Bacillus sp. 1P10SD]|uniref:YphA family membrane protein n=1 Tax=Bacillus sp. 1P10SD TaxID=3132265 RepID=UPI0039A6C551